MMTELTSPVRQTGKIDVNRYSRARHRLGGGWQKHGKHGGAKGPKYAAEALELPF
jgi:hypothetical protein